MTATKTSAQLSFLEHSVRSMERDQAAATAAPLDPLKTGVVFVHGIGSQIPGETILQWSAPIIQSLTAWRVQTKATDRPIDPVARAEVNFGDGLSAIELRIPPTTAGGKERRWILTEAWWASHVAPPSLGTMTSWLGPQGASGRIVAGILGNPEAGGLLTSGAIALAKFLLVPFVSVLAAIVLTIFALVRAVSGLIPIAAVRESAILTSFDTFLTGWFGDVRILLYDPAQSANIRGGLARAVRALRAEGCGKMVIVAHSGGVMVSFLTLTDPALSDVQIDKLITFGEGWNLALRLSPKEPPDGSGLADRLRTDITKTQKTMLWRDFWGTNDPAPDGPLLVEEMGKTLARSDAIRSGKVWNRRSLVDDHGTYWTNDEEFVIPVIREIDVPDGWGESSIFYPPDPPATGRIPATAATPSANAGSPASPGGSATTPAPAAASAPLTTQLGPPSAWPPPGGVEPGPRAERHRQRIATLAMWRQTAIAVPVAIIAIALARYPQRLIEIGHEAARLIGMIPGVSHLNGLIGWFGDLDKVRIVIAAGPIGPIGPIQFDLIERMTYWGIGVLQAVVIIAIIQLGSAWVRGFKAWNKGTATYYAAIALETFLFLLLGFSLYVVIVSDNHGKLLGSGLEAWRPGLIVTAATALLAVGGSWFARVIGSPATTRAFGSVAAVIFIAAMACAVVAIFGPEGLPDAEVAYVVIWAAFVIMYRLGMVRWHHWDRLERQIASETVAPATLWRWPAYLTSLALLLTTAAISIFILGWNREDWRGYAVALLVLAAGAAGAGYIIGTASSRGRRDPVAAPDPVETAMGL
jgi:hypothetical protein